MKETPVRTKDVIAKPRISINKLAEYTKASASRRKKIVYDCKYPESFITTRYKEAREVSKQYVLGKVDKTYVKEIISKFRKFAASLPKLPESDFKIQDSETSAQCLESLLMLKLPDLSSWDVSLFSEPKKLLIINGLAVSVNPDLVLKKQINGVMNIGVIKLHIVKSNNLSDESQKVVSVMLRVHAAKFIADKKNNEIVNPKFCISVDIFKKEFAVCPPSVIQRLKSIEDSCQEIVLWWDIL